MTSDLMQPIPYETPAMIDRRRRMVLRCFGIAAAVIAVRVALSITMTAIVVTPQLRAYLAQVGLWVLYPIVQVMSLPILVGCAATTLRGRDLDEVKIVRLGRVAAIVAILFITLHFLDAVAFVRANGVAGMMTSGVFPSLCDRLSRLAAFLPLLLIILLMPVHQAATLRGRLIALAALASVITGLAGVAALAWSAMAHGLQAALRMPVPIIGLWPTAGFASAALFAVGYIRPRGPYLWLAITLIVFFQAMSIGSGWDALLKPLLAPPWTLRMGVGQLQESAEVLVNIFCHLMPAWLVAWSLWRDRERFLADA